MVSFGRPSIGHRARKIFLVEPDVLLFGKTHADGRRRNHAFGDDLLCIEQHENAREIELQVDSVFQNVEKCIVWIGQIARRSDVAARRNIKRFCAIEYVADCKRRRPRNPKILYVRMRKIERIPKTVFVTRGQVDVGDQ